jgi:hypothetical protein
MAAHCGMAGDLVIIDQVAACLLRRGVLGAGDQECARLGDLMDVPSGFECALPEDQVHVAAFPHAQACPRVSICDRTAPLRVGWVGQVSDCFSATMQDW